VNETTATKRGYKTTEFRLSLLAALLGFLVPSSVMDAVPEEE